MTRGEQLLAAPPAHAPGTFSWADLAIPDPQGAKRFYTGVLGWTVWELPAGGGATYTLLRRHGRDVAGLSGRDPAQTAQDAPPSWLPYVSVASADEAARRAAELGGSVLGEPFDVMDAGRMALLRDPTGAVLAVWEAGTHPGAGLLGAPGSIGWVELLTRDTERAAEFYTRLFGWRAEPRRVAGMEYTVFYRGSVMAAGMARMQPAWGDAPPHWLVDFAVEDVDAAAERAEELGGTVMAPPEDVPEVGRFAMLRDPQGATFCLLRYDPAS